MMRRAVLLLSAVAACAPAGEERLGASRQAFDSAESVLVDFQIDGELVAATDDPAVTRSLVRAQLMYTVGTLNASRSVGWLGRLELSSINATPTGNAGSFAVTYSATLPVAWGADSKPSTVSLIVPARVGVTDQQSFATKYGKTCVDPAAGEVDAGRMFLHFRPQRAECVLDPSDVVVLSAKVLPSSQNTVGRYPEYHRIWEDDALDVVAMFSRAKEPAQVDDEGARAFEDFVGRVGQFVRELQPDVEKRTMEWPRAFVVRRTAQLQDGRSLRIETALVSARLADEGETFDEWYDGVTPRADVILFNGHAHLGENVRTLMDKGVFVPGKYLLWAMNGCDTFAYVDSTLARRRAVLNPDDPSGTKYLDIVSNVMAGYFATGPATSLTLLDAFIAARARKASPRTYREIFRSIDPRQVVTVTGEEDNEFRPTMFAESAEPEDPVAEVQPNGDHAPPARDEHDVSHLNESPSSGCRVADSEAARSNALVCVALLLFAGTYRRRIRHSEDGTCARDRSVRGRHNALRERR